MSGIYIPGVSVPADDTVLLRVYPEENGYYFVERIDGIDQDFLGSYWAVHVPPHGRSIDADEFLKRAIGTKCFRGDYALMLEELVGESTTIIPEEEGET